MNLTQLKTALSFFVLLCLSCYGAMAQSIDFTLVYNNSSSQYEVYGRATATLNNVDLHFSQVTVVLPDSAPNTVITASNGWVDNLQAYAPASQPANDFHSFALHVPSSYSFPANTEVLLFSFVLTSCMNATRMYVNGTDAFLNGDLVNNINDNNTLTNHTGLPYNNTGITCLTVSLGVNLLSFTAQKLGDDVLLNWRAADEDLLRYNVQRSTDNKSWQTLSSLLPMNSPAEQASYCYKDIYTGPATPALYYRLQMIDIDGTVLYSKVARVQREGNALAAVLLMPNPVAAGEMVSIKGMVSDAPVHLSVWDMAGVQKMKTTLNSTQTFLLSTTGWAPGLHVIRMETLNGAQVHSPLMVK
jgi:hypothetical protein